MQYCDILQYCNVCCFNVVNAQSLHHKNDWTSRNLDCTLEFLCFYTVIQGAYCFLYCQNPYSHRKCLFTKIQSNIVIWQYIAIHSNTIRNMALTHIVSPLIYHTVKTLVNWQITAIRQVFLPILTIYITFPMQMDFNSPKFFPPNFLQSLFAKVFDCQWFLLYGNTHKHRLIHKETTVLTVQSNLWNKTLIFKIMIINFNDAFLHITPVLLYTVGKHYWLEQGALIHCTYWSSMLDCLNQLELPSNYSIDVLQANITNKMSSIVEKSIESQKLTTVYTITAIMSSSYFNHYITLAGWSWMNYTLND